MEFIFKDRWKNTSDSESSLKVFDYFKDMDLILNMGFNFKTGTWFEFIGFMEKIFNEENALSKRVQTRSYKKPSKGKSAMQKYENEEHSQKSKSKIRYSLQIYTEESGQKQLDAFFNSKRK